MSDFCNSLVEMAQSTDLSGSAGHATHSMDDGLATEALAAVIGSGTLSDPGPDPLPDPDPFPNEPDPS